MITTKLINKLSATLSTRSNEFSLRSEDVLGNSISVKAYPGKKITVNAPKPFLMYASGKESSRTKSTTSMLTREIVRVIQYQMACSVFMKEEKPEGDRFNGCLRLIFPSL
jgi:hypothetical protein